MALGEPSDPCKHRNVRRLTVVMIDCICCSLKSVYDGSVIVDMLFSRHRLSSSGGSVSRMSQLESRFTGHRNQPQPTESYIVSPYQNQLSPCAWDNPPGYTVRPVVVPRAIEPTHFHWNTSSRRKQRRNNIPADGRPADYKTVMNCTVSI